MKRFFSLLLCLVIIPMQLLFAQGNNKNRVIVLTDIEADPDDTQSLIRLLLYANQIDIEAIIATTSCWKKNSIAPESIHRIVNAYGKVQPNLLKHEPGFPSAAAMLAKIKKGIPAYGLSGVGEGKDSEGSAFIIHTLKKNDNRPLWVAVWGGANTLAQALYKIEKTNSPAEAKRLISKLRVYTISDQDDSGNWMRNKFPDLFYIVSPGDAYGSATWSAINSHIDSINNETISNSWLLKNIQQGHGPLGALYPDVSWGMEGDTPSFLSLIPNGLNTPEHPDWGGWGGRYEFYKPDVALQKKGSSDVPLQAETRAIWTDATDHYIPNVYSEYGRANKVGTVAFDGNKVTLWRWRDDFQHDFAARIDWCVKSYKEANHPPVPVVTEPDSITVKSELGFNLSAINSTDPDGDNLSFFWFNYPEAGTYKQLIKINSPENSHSIYVVAPKVEKTETAHFILKVTDKGSPSLSRYKRIVVTIKP